MPQPERLLDRVEKTMKALLISPQFNFMPDELLKVTQATSDAGITTLSISAFIFDLKTASHLLANLQNFLSGRGYRYHLIYLQDEFDHFQYLGQK